MPTSTSSNKAPYCRQIGECFAKRKSVTGHGFICHILNSAYPKDKKCPFMKRAKDD